MKTIQAILELARTAPTGGTLAMATVMKVRGSAYRRPGARMLITADGRTAGDPDRLTAGLNAHTVMLSRNGRRLAYSTLTLSSNLWSIRVPDRPPISIREAIPLTSGAQIVEGVAVSPDGQFVVCANAAADTLSVIDTHSESVIETIWAKAKPSGSSRPCSRYTRFPPTRRTGARIT